MNFQHDERQDLLLQTTDALLDEPRSAGEDELDSGLLAALHGAGLIEETWTAASGVLDGVLLTERLSRANGMVPFGVCSMVGGLVSESLGTEVLAVARESRSVPARYARFASRLLVVDAFEARLYEVDPSSAEPVSANYGYPLAVPGPRVKCLATCDAQPVLRRWRLAIGAEMVGAMDGAMSSLLTHLAQRKQFGQPLGSFQAIQHRMAEHAVALENVRWLVREAAWEDCDHLAATAAGFAAGAGYRFCLDAHQLFGARGFLLETGLYRWTLRMKFLSMEGGGERVHAEAAAAARWDA